MSARLDLHANAVALGEIGVLIRGPSGAGKSALTFALIDEAASRGHYGALVADDRTLVTASHGRLIARGVSGFEGLIECRGAGILRVNHEAAVVIRFVVDLTLGNADPPRYPSDDEENVKLLDVLLPRLIADLRPGVVHAARMTLRRLGIAPRECPAIRVFA